jgi:hypothetical protein
MTLIKRILVDKANKKFQNADKIPTTALLAKKNHRRLPMESGDIIPCGRKQ